MTYRVKVKHFPNWQAYDTCTLGISVGNHYHHDQALKDLLAWATEHFARCRISISDYIQRHNYQLVTGIEYAELLALKEGNDWMRANIQSLQCFADKLDIYWYRDWLAHPDFDELMQQIQKLYRTDSGFRAAVILDVSMFLNRRRKSFPDLDVGRFVYHARSYVLEELAVFALRNKELGGIELYPGKELYSSNYLRTQKPQTAPTALTDRPFASIRLIRKAVPVAEPELRLAS